mmetsp:Transcript_3870/g.8822  ORF Transcript_3870/g.8822 Transcript_3870/m.8822 type:complete len:203 (-) Transcript_3870:414-1022(-)
MSTMDCSSTLKIILYTRLRSNCEERYVATFVIFRAKNSGTPGRMKMFRHCRTGHSSVDRYRSFALEGRVAILIWAEVNCFSLPAASSFLGLILFRSKSAISSLCTNSTSNASATPLIVTSSCVGPTPPEVITTSTSLRNRRISAVILSTSSDTTTTRESCMHSFRRALAAVCVLVSVVIPFSISSPTTRIPTVFVSPPKTSK